MSAAESTPSAEVEQGAMDPLGLLLEELAPGVLGYTVNRDELIYVPMIEATRPGHGDVGRFLDSLGPNHRIPNVVSETLALMLIRRGWHIDHEWADEFDQFVDVWRPPS